MKRHRQLGLRKYNFQNRKHYCSMLARRQKYDPIQRVLVCIYLESIHVLNLNTLSLIKLNIKVSKANI